MTKNTIADFWDKVFVLGEHDCWEWIASKVPDGYGHFWFEGKRYSAHRFSWMVASGEHPGVWHVLHECDNPSCVNPRHLFLGTNLDNVRDSVAKDRRSHHNTKGEANGQSKLTNEKVLLLHALYATGEFSQMELASYFEVTQGAIWCALVGKTWRHVRGRVAP